jgi:hypothetical protein
MRLKIISFKTVKNIACTIMLIYIEAGYDKIPDFPHKRDIQGIYWPFIGIK